MVIHTVDFPHLSKRAGIGNRIYWNSERDPWIDNLTRERRDLGLLFLAAPSSLVILLNQERWEQSSEGSNRISWNRKLELWVENLTREKGLGMDLLGGPELLSQNAKSRKVRTVKSRQEVFCRNEVLCLTKKDHSVWWSHCRHKHPDALEMMTINPLSSVLSPLTFQLLLPVLILHGWVISCAKLAISAYGTMKSLGVYSCQFPFLQYFSLCLPWGSGRSGGGERKSWRNWWRRTVLMT